VDGFGRGLEVVDDQVVDMRTMITHVVGSRGYVGVGMWADGLTPATCMGLRTNTWLPRTCGFRKHGRCGLDPWLLATPPFSNEFPADPREAYLDEALWRLGGI